jgi:hemoglobin
MTTDDTESTLFEAVGGSSFFERLVDGFYARVAADPVLLPLYPEADLAPARHRLSMFLIQYWGGPTTYSEQRGHPALRMRHFPYRIGPSERDHWLAAMQGSLDDLDPDPEVRRKLLDYFVMAAEHLRNDHPMRITGSS